MDTSEDTGFFDSLKPLVVMTKGEETIEVHRSCVDSHERVGWVVA